MHTERLTCRLKTRPSAYKQAHTQCTYTLGHTGTRAQTHSPTHTFTCTLGHRHLYPQQSTQVNTHQHMCVPHPRRAITHRTGPGHRLVPRCSPRSAAFSREHAALASLPPTASDQKPPPQPQAVSSTLPVIPPPSKPPLPLPACMRKRQS